MSEPETRLRRIGQPDARLHRAGFGPAWLALGAPTLAAGSYLCAVGMRLLPVPVDLDPPLRVVAATGLGLTLFGGLLVLRTIRGLVLRWRTRVLRRRHPQEPWRFDFPWDPGGIADARGSRLVTELSGLVLLWCLVTPFVGVAINVPEFPLLGKVVVAGAVALALWLTGAVLRGARRFVRYGRSWIAFGSFPFSPGGTLEVTLRPARFQALSVTLRYVEERFEVEEIGQSDDRQTRVDHAAYVHHEEGRRIEVPAGASAVPIRFQLPNRPEWITQLTAKGRVRYWELVVQAEDPDADFSTSFPLPVYLPSATGSGGEEPAGALHHQPGRPPG